MAIYRVEWTLKEVATVKQMAAAGASALMISRALGTRTRNAVLGFMFRNEIKSGVPVGVNIEKRKKAKKYDLKPLDKPKKPSLKDRSIGARLEYIKAVKADIQQRISQDELEITDNCKTILNLRYGDCRAVIGKVHLADTLYCSRPKAANSSYCIDHKLRYTRKA
jgi:hypothetical protein